MPIEVNVIATEAEIVVPVMVVYKVVPISIVAVSQS